MGKQVGVGEGEHGVERVSTMVIFMTIVTQLTIPAR